MDNRKMDTNKIDRARLVQNLSQKLKAYYVFADIAEEIAVLLHSHLDQGDYTHVTDDDQLAEILTRHIQEVNQDKHLIVQWHPDPLPNHEGPIHENQDMLEEWHQAARTDNYGLHKAERLPGNVGLLDIREFCLAAWAGDTAVAAMNFLANTEVLIIDLRKC